MACDTCRRRKVRCNDEKPICNNCAKRDVYCTYFGEPGPPKKSRPSQRGPSLDGSGLGLTPRAHPRSPRRDFEPGRLERLENLVNELARQVPGSSEIIERIATTPRNPQTHGHDGAETPLAERYASAFPTEGPGARNIRRYEQSDTASIYSTFVHCQPLPLFDPSRVPVKATDKGLGGSIAFALMALREPARLDALHIADLLRKSIYDDVARGQVNLLLAQGLCVLVLLSIKNEEWIAAQVALGTAGRVVEELLLWLPSAPTSHNSTSLDTLRCAQSVFILECILRRSTREMPRLDHINHLAGVDNSATDIDRMQGTQPDNNPVDLGVQQYCLQLFLIWTRTVAYLDTFRTSTARPWQSGSEYQTILQELYAFETSFAQDHRVGNLRLEDRTAQELEDHRTYWAPWFTMQFLFHAIQALANHPMIHITRVGSDLGFRPPSFSQQTADQARLHAGWVSRLVRVCQEKNFKVYDPFIGHLVAAVSTVQLFFMDDRSSHAAQEAMDCHRTFEAFLKDMAESWPQLRNTVRRLELLAQCAAPSAFSANDPYNGSNGTTALPKHTAQLDLLLPMFQYSLSSRPLPAKDAPQNSVALPSNLEFLTPLNRAATSASESRERQASISGPHGFGTFSVDDMNIFDTSDLLNTTLLDGSLWPGQL